MTVNPHGLSNERALRMALLTVIGVICALYLLLPFRLNINWDEFRFLSVVYEFQRGILQSTLQTIHVHLFQWLPYVGTNEVDQIIVARLVYWVFLSGTCALTYIIARHFISRTAALFVVLAYLSHDEVIAHATAFRFDGLSIVLLLSAVALALRGRSKAATAWAGGVGALALLVTVKSAFYLPAIVLILLARGRRKTTFLRGGLSDLGLFLGALLGSFALLYALHTATLASGEPSTAVGLLNRSGGQVIVFDPLIPSRRYLITSIGLNPLTWICVLVGLGIATWRSVKGQRRRAGLQLLALATPLGSLLFYRNAFPYFYPFLLPSALVAGGIAFECLLQSWRDGRTSAVPAVALFVTLFLGFGIHYSRRFDDGIHVQRTVLEAVHDMFAEPVPYIDRNSMISSFPKVGFFMSTWGFRAYESGGEPIFRDILGREQPKLLLANHPSLVLDPTAPTPATPGQDELHPADQRVLGEHFVHHWGPIYVAGKRCTTGEAPKDIEVIIQGTYTIEARGPVLLDGARRMPGDFVSLETGRHTLKSLVGDQEVVLRWGKSLPRPRGRAPTGVLFQDFY